MKYTNEEWLNRVNLAACYHLADYFNMSDIVWNHITAKTSKDKDTFMSIKIDQFAASSIDIRVLCYTSTKHFVEWLEIKDRLVIEIKKIVEKNGSSFAFPSTSIYVEKN